MTSSEKLCFIGATVALGLFLRASVSLHGYSGESKPPMYGDYEAQRHWQEVCVNLPVSDWYRNTTDNDLMYWGLDYPPLTAYHSFLVGIAANTLNSSYVSLHKSRGITCPTHKHFMRWTVLVADIFVYVPAVLLAIEAVASLSSQRQTTNTKLLHVLFALIYPGQILIDNGHFQYNNLSLGFMLIAVACIVFDRSLLAAASFCLALNYKQMELYHALPFFFYLLRNCFARKKQSFGDGIVNLVKLGLVVLLIFGILWAPWLRSIDDFLLALRRIFPLARGVFEDKVANVWCVLNVVVKIKEKFSNEFMAMVCIVATLLAALPNCMHLFFRPDKLNLLYSLVNTSSAFFLFSFQVHEKSILLVALPVLLLLPIERLASHWFLLISVFSMFPLLEKDGLTTAFVSTMITYCSVLYVAANIGSGSASKNQGLKRPEKAAKPTNYLKMAFILSISIAVCLTIAYLYVVPPTNLPHLFSLAIAAYSCVHFVGFFCYFNYRQFFRSKVIF